MKMKKKTVRRSRKYPLGCRIIMEKKIGLSSSGKYPLKSFHIQKKKTEDLNNENMETNQFSKSADEDGPDEEAPLIGADDCTNCLLIVKKFAELQSNLLANVGKWQAFKILFPVPPSSLPLHRMGSPNQDSVSAHVHHLAKTVRSDLEDCIRDALDFIEQDLNNNKNTESSDEEPDVCIKCLPAEKSLAQWETKVMGFVNKLNAYMDFFLVPTPTPPVPTPTSPVAY